MVGTIYLTGFLGSFIAFLATICDDVYHYVLSALIPVKHVFWSRKMLTSWLGYK